MDREIKQRNVTTFLAFIAIVAVAASVLVAYILGKAGLGGQIVSILNIVSIILSSIVCAITAFGYVKRKGNVWLTITYIVAVVIVLVFVVLP